MIERELLVIRVFGEELACLISSVDPLEHLNCSGSVLLIPRPEAGPVAEILTAADPLTDLWAASDGTLWACSGNGLIWTTAEVITAPGVPIHETTSGVLRWTCQTVPVLTALKYAPDLTRIWGLGAPGMVAISFEGSVYRWNGRDWFELAALGIGPLTAVGGRSMDDFLVGAEHGVLVRFRAGEQIPITLEAGGRVTGIEAFDGELWILDDKGRLYVINDDDIPEVLVEIETSAYGLCACEDALYISSADGLWRMNGEQIENMTTSLFSLCFTGPKGPLLLPLEGAERLYFVEGSFPVDGQSEFKRFDLPVRAVSE
jgi:hypothetical protein